MKPICYVEESFFDFLDDVCDQPNPISESQMALMHYKSAIKSTLLTLPVEANLSTGDIIDCYKQAQDLTHISSSSKEEIIKKALLDDRLCTNGSYESNPANCIYFGNECKPTELEIATVDTTSSNSIFFNCPTERFDLPEDLQGIENYRHSANSILIIDSYLFKDHTKNKLKTKNLIKFLRQFVTDKSFKYYFSVVAWNEKKENMNSIVEKLIENTKNEFAAFNLNISVFLTISKMNPDRHIITNYNHSDSGHPFDRATHLNSDYLFSSNEINISSRGSKIETKYARVNRILQKITTDFNSFNGDEIIGVGKIKFGNILENKIFQ